jgi:hypothetical protein
MMRLVTVASGRRVFPFLVRRAIRERAGNTPWRTCRQAIEISRPFESPRERHQIKHLGNIPGGSIISDLKSTDNVDIPERRHRLVSKQRQRRAAPCVYEFARVRTWGRFASRIFA